MPQRTVRMGTTNRSRRATLVVIALIGLAAGVFMLFGWRRVAEPMEKKGGCAGDVDCGAQRVCARGGCLPLITTESAAQWRADLDAQISPETPWRPRPAYGAKWVFADACPIPPGPAAPLEEAKVSLVQQTRVFEILKDRLRIHVHKSERGARWLEAMRFLFLQGEPLDLARTCASAAVAQAEVAGGRSGVLHVALKQTVPAGALASATASVETELPPADRDGLRILKLPLEAVAEGAVAITAAAVPLGADVARMGGPAPLRQRLLSGFAVYYWRHTQERGNVAIALDLGKAGAAELPLDDLKP